MAGSTAPAPGVQARGRWPYAAPAQRGLLLAALLVGLGAFLPWVETPVRSFTGLAGPGLWTLYAASLGLAGALVRSARLAGWQAAVLGLVAVGLPVWQLARLLRLAGVQGWLPGIGLVLTAGGGVLALRAALALLRDG
jgi:hypothetical protein